MKRRKAVINHFKNFTWVHIQYVKLKIKIINLRVIFESRRTQFPLPARYGDLLLNLHGTLLKLIDHRDFYPFDQKFYRHVFVGCFRPRFVVVVPFKNKNSFNYNRKISIHKLQKVRVKKFKFRITIRSVIILHFQTLF